MKQLCLGGRIPWTEIENYLESALNLDLAPEIAITGPELDSMDETLLDQIAQILKQNEIRPTVHAPFFDLNPGALDPLIRQVTLQRLSQTLSVANRLNAHLMVIHPGIDKWRYPNLDLAWLKLAKGFFPPLIEQAATCDCRLVIENIYEEMPDTLIRLVDGIDSEWFGHCFDIGHWHLFGKQPMSEWLEAISPRLFHLHLHDNHGRADEHLPVGEGTIDFTPLQTMLSKRSSFPSITLEAHSVEHLQQSLQKTIELLG